MLQSRGEDLVNIIRGESNSEETRDLKAAEEVAKRFVAWEIDLTGGPSFQTELAKILG